jgi:hypothetical protein
MHTGLYETSLRGVVSPSTIWGKTAARATTREAAAIASQVRAALAHWYYAQSIGVHLLEDSQTLSEVERECGSYLRGIAAASRVVARAAVFPALALFLLIGRAARSGFSREA